jgi:uncharacterized protein
MPELVLLLLAASAFEVVDSGLGMMYGTLLSPILLMLGYPSSEVIPSILISQAVGGFVGSIFHHKNKNSDFTKLKGDFGLVLIVIVMGLFASFVGVMFAHYIPDKALKLYIGFLAVVMGILCVLKVSYQFSAFKVTVIGFLASFNKSATGGGFGPLCSTGLMVGGVKSSTSIAITTLSEVPLCLVSFVLYFLSTQKLPKLSFMFALIFGAMVGGVFGPKVTANINHQKLKITVGILAVISGAIVILKTLN